MIRIIRTSIMTICLEVLVISCLILCVTSQVDISRWKHHQEVATLSSKEEIVLSYSRVKCATFCKYRSCDSFVYGYDKKCQTLHGEVDALGLQKGEQYEHWVRSDTKTQGPIAGTLVVYSEEYLYWFDISTRERIAKLKHPGFKSDCLYDTKREIFYWAEQNGAMKYAKLSFGKVGRANRILRKPVGHFCIDFDQEMIFYSKAPPQTYGDFVRYSRKTKEHIVLVKNTNKFLMWSCSVDPSKTYIFYGVTSKGITRIDYNGDDERFILKADLNTVFFNVYDQNLYWIDAYDEDNELARIIYRQAYGTSDTKQLDLNMDGCFNIYVHGNVIYYHTYGSRGVSVVTLDGTPLPAIGTMDIASDDEPNIFLFK